ncbi:MAG: radical SAM-associated putative lipoprotein [Bacteroidaceae bacterium]|nr:radical SAM-associated putative lipoprotein [Bacteroidaceae bacterium]
MKLEKKTFVARLCAAVLALLGFASCERIWDARTEYGTPSMDFMVKGTVTDEASNPLEGIRVIVRKEANNQPRPNQSYVDYYGRYHMVGGDDTLYTDVKGKYETEVIDAFAVLEQKVYFDDVDGVAGGGAFKSDSVVLRTAPNKQYKKGDGNWYDGGYEYTVDVQLQKK